MKAMDEQSRESGQDARVGFPLRAGETANHKVDALLDLLEKKGIIDAAEARAVRIAKIY